MHGILVSGLFSALGWIFRQVVIKFVIFFALFYIVTELFGYAAPLIIKEMNPTGLGATWGGLPPALLYFLSYFKLGALLSAGISAYSTRFVIRRIPFLN